MGSTALNGTKAPSHPLKRGFWLRLSGDVFPKQEQATKATQQLPGARQDKHLIHVPYPHAFPGAVCDQQVP